MHTFTKAALALLAASPAVFASPIQHNTSAEPSTTAPSTTAPPATGTQEPCGVLSSLQAELKKSNPNGVLTVPAAQATECLNSVALNKENAIAVAKGVQQYAQFQSTLSYLKNPPAEDKNQAKQPYDIMGDLKKLVEDLEADKYTREMDFEYKLKIIAANANDGHFVTYLGGVLAIQFQAPFDIVSISKDGIELPKIYQAKFNSDSTVAPTGPAITKIDDTEVVEFLENIVAHTGLQSPDARFNSLFPTHGLGGAIDANGRFRRQPNYPGKDTFTVTYEDGTTKKYNYSAIIAGDFSEVKDGASFYQVFVKDGQRLKSPPPDCPNGNQPVFSQPVSPSRGELFGAIGSRPVGNAKPAAIEVGPGHHMSLRQGKKIDIFQREARLNVPNRRRLNGLEPVVKDRAGIFGGYFVDNDRKGTAVLQLLSFAPDCSSDLPDTIAKIAEFLDLCRKEGTQNLIIDLANNGGGYIVLGYDLYMQLFPEKKGEDAYSGQRQRSPKAGALMADAFANVTYDDIKKNANSSLYQSIAYSNWSPPTVLDENNKPFKDHKDFVGPYKTNDDDYTAIWRFNVTDPYVGLGLEDPSLTDDKTAPFKPENIVIFTDGQCSSTCSTFSEFMETQKKVRTVVVGGIPKKQPMPLVGGVRGSEILQFDALRASAQAVDEIDPNASASEKEARLAELPQDLPLPMLGAVNFLDNVRKGEEIPLQFIEEPSTCRLFWTEESYAKTEVLYKQIADAMFNGNGQCADQGKGYKKPARAVYENLRYKYRY